MRKLAAALIALTLTVGTGTPADAYGSFRGHIKLYGDTWLPVFYNSWCGFHAPRPDYRRWFILVGVRDYGNVITGSVWGSSRSWGTCD